MYSPSVRTIKSDFPTAKERVFDKKCGSKTRNERVTICKHRRDARDPSAKLVGCSALEKNPKIGPFAPGMVLVRQEI
jgi:hypothetical protein